MGNKKKNEGLFRGIESDEDIDDEDIAMEAPTPRSIHEWNARSAYSSNRLSNCKQYICQGVEGGIFRGVTLHGDEMAKTPMFINYNDRGRGGYMMVDDNKKAVIENDTHNFPVGSAMSIATSGIVKCNRPSGGGDSLIKARTFRPARTEVFLRPVRHNPSSTLGVMHDLMQFVEKDDETQLADVILYVSDNGGTYGGNKMLVQFVLGRLWRQRGYAALFGAAYSAGDSPYNWEIESQWSQPRQKSWGKQFGRSAVRDPRTPFAEFDNKEDAFRAIAATALTEFKNLCETCNTGDPEAKTPSLQPWTVNLLTESAHPLLPDAQDIIEFFQAGPRKCRGAKFAAIAKERADHVAHMEKSPSFIQCKMCLGAHCSACAGVIEKRRASQTSWDPATILAPLQFNNGWFPFPHFRNSRDEASAEAQAARVAGDREPNEAAEEHPPGGTVFVHESDGDGTEPRSSAVAPVARGGTATPTEDEILARQPNSAHRQGIEEMPPMLGSAASPVAFGPAIPASTPLPPPGPQPSAKLDSLAGLLEAAVRRQDYSDAARLKAAHQAEKEEVLKHQATLLPRPDAVAVPTVPDDVWATRTNYPFLPWSEVLSIAQPQTRVLIPISQNPRTEQRSKRIEKILPCRHKHCRYWSSSKAEHDRHDSHDHLVPPRVPQPLAPPQPAPLAGCSLKGAMPRVRPRKKAKAGKAKASRAADDEDPTGRRATEAADPSDADARRPRAAKRPEYEVLKALLPFAGKNGGCKINVDLFRSHRYVVTYDHRRFQLEVEATIIEQLPDKYKYFSHDPGTFGPDNDPATMDAKLKLALDWIWEKHCLMTGETRPKETTSTA